MSCKKGIKLQFIWCVHLEWKLGQLRKFQENSRLTWLQAIQSNPIPAIWDRNNFALSAFHFSVCLMVVICQHNAPGLEDKLIINLRLLWQFDKFLLKYKSLPMKFKSKILLFFTVNQVISRLFFKKHLVWKMCHCQVFELRLNLS